MSSLVKTNDQSAGVEHVAVAGRFLSPVCFLDVKNHFQVALVAHIHTLSGKKYCFAKVLI